MRPSGRTAQGEPFGHPGNRSPAVLRLLAVVRGRRARYDASPRLAFDRFPGLRAPFTDMKAALRYQGNQVSVSLPDGGIMRFSSGMIAGPSSTAPSQEKRLP